MLILLTECLVNTSCELEWTKRDVVSARNPMSLTLTLVGGMMLVVVMLGAGICQDSGHCGYRTQWSSGLPRNGRKALTQRSKNSSWNPEIEVSKSFRFHCKVVGVDAPGFVIQSINQWIQINLPTEPAAKHSSNHSVNLSTNLSIIQSTQPFRPLFNLLIKSGCPRKSNQSSPSSINQCEMPFCFARRLTTYWRRKL